MTEIISEVLYAENDNNVYITYCNLIGGLMGFSSAFLRE